MICHAPAPAPLPSRLYATLLDDACGIRFFRQFRLAKTFVTWKSVVRRQRFRARTRQITDNSCLFGNR